MSRYKTNRINWIDLETTGLDPEKDDILEVALVITDGELDELFAESWVVRHPSELRFTPSAYKMHSSSGLLDERAWSYLGEIDRFVANHMRDYDSVGAPLGGNSPQFDRGFIRRHMTQVDEALSYRHFDASTLVQAAQTWGLDLPDPEPEHRAMSDIRRSIELARRFKGLVCDG